MMVKTIASPTQLPTNKSALRIVALPPDNEVTHASELRAAVLYPAMEGVDGCFFDRTRADDTPGRARGYVRRRFHRAVSPSTVNSGDWE